MFGFGGKVIERKRKGEKEVIFLIWLGSREKGGEKKKRREVIFLIWLGEIFFFFFLQDINFTLI